MNTAKQLISAFVDAPPLYWDRSYVQNMRGIRGYPNWWRIRDDVSYIDGPPQEGEQYTKGLYVWKAEIVKDEAGNNSNKIELYNLINTLTVTEEVIDGETVYSYKYRDVPPELEYTHTAVVDSVSTEFDQLGRRLVAFESMGDVYLIWYDSQAGATVTTNFGAGYTPQIVTDTYRRTGGSADSERFLFYVDNTTKQIVYRRQADRYGVVYNLPTAPSDVVEILKVSKNLYGGLTALYCYEDVGVLTTGSFTARDAPDTINVGTDNTSVDDSKFSPKEAIVTNFTLKIGGVPVEETGSSSLIAMQSSVINFELRPAQIYLGNQYDTAEALSAQSGDVLDFFLKSAVINAAFSEVATYIDTASGDILEFTLAITRIDQSAIEPVQNLDIASGDILEFTLG